MKKIFVCLLVMCAGCGTSIHQEVEQCGQENKFLVRTWINDGFRNTVYSTNTWMSNLYKINSCLDASQVDSAKKAEYKRAKEFIKIYKKIK